jgi:hypothetical protein
MYARLERLLGDGCLCDLHLDLESLEAIDEREWIDECEVGEWRGKEVGDWSVDEYISL